MKINRREFMALTAAAALVTPSLATPVDYGDPDMDFRDWNTNGVPSSGLYRPHRVDGEKWYARLGLTIEDAHSRGLVDKSKLRNECRKWLTDHSHRCSPADLI